MTAQILIEVKADRSAKIILAGLPGRPGARWFSGPSAPSGATGIIGDWYINATTAQGYEKTGATTWTYRFTFTAIGNSSIQISDVVGLSAALSTESSTRASADTTLQTNITAEAATRAAAITTLQNALTAEATSRTSADASLQAAINALAVLIDTSMKKPEAFTPSGTYPTTYGGIAIQAGDTFRVSAGTVGTKIVNAEDLLIALLDSPGQTETNWQIIESNRDQATQTVKGVLKIVAGSEIIDQTSTNDTDAVTAKKFWQGFLRGLTTTDFFDAVLTAPVPIVNYNDATVVAYNDAIGDAFRKLQGQSLMQPILVHGGSMPTEINSNTGYNFGGNLFDIMQESYPEYAPIILPIKCYLQGITITYDYFSNFYSGDKMDLLVYSPQENLYKLVIDQLIDPTVQNQFYCDCSNLGIIYDPQNNDRLSFMLQTHAMSTTVTMNLRIIAHLTPLFNL